MLLPRCPECKTDVTLTQLRASDAVRCSSLGRRAFHTSCVALPDDVLKLLLNPNILWPCDSFVVANDSHSKIDDFDDKLNAAGVDTFAGHHLQAFPHLSESFSQQHRQLLAFLTALSSSSDSLLTHHRQHQPELLLSTLCDIRRPPGSEFGALLGVALTSFSVALLMLHQQHQPELLLFALRDIRCPPGSNIGAILGVALSSSCYVIQSQNVQIHITKYLNLRNSSLIIIAHYV